MSQTVDQRVVQMKMDNADFEKKAAQSSQTLEKLKKNLDVDKSAQSLDNLGKAAKNLDLQKVGDDAEKVGSSFNVMEKMATAAITRVTNAMFDMGKALVNNMLTPMKTGMEEYETQINATQTILANASRHGYNINDVTGALDELNHYADLTIYNFTEMTRNIGYFTAAGIDLKESVRDVKGLSNVAALLGADATQAARATYQLSQAMAAGVVQLQDWRSMEQAGMAGEAFQEVIKETARVHGINIDKMIEEEGNFRLTLSKKWLTADIMGDALSVFNGDLDEAQLRAMGFSETASKEFAEMGKTALDAATKVKTMTQLMGTIAEAQQSTWTETWRLLIGDFEEARELYSEIWNAINPIIEAQGEARNNMIREWKEMGGRTEVIEAIRHVLTELWKVITAVSGAFKKVFPKSDENRLYQITHAFHELAMGVNFSEEQLASIKGVVENVLGIFGFLKGVLSDVFQFLFAPRTTETIFNETAMGMQDIVHAGGILTELFYKLKEGLSAFNDIWQQLFGSEKTHEIFNETAMGMQTVVDQEAGIFIKAAENLKNSTPPWDAMRDAVVGLGKGVVGSFNDIAGSISILAMLKTAGMVAVVALTATLAAVFWNLAKLAKDMREAFGGIGEAFGNLNDYLEAQALKVKAEAIYTIAKAIALLAASLLLLGIVPTDVIFQGLLGLGTAMFALTASVKAMVKAFSGLSDKKTFKEISTFALLVATVAVSALILSKAVAKLGSLKFTGIIQGLGGLAVTIGLMYFALKQMSKIDKEIVVTAAVLSGFSTSLLALAGSVKILSMIDLPGLAKGMGAMIIALGAVFAFVWGIKKTGADSDLTKFGISMIAIAAGITALIVPITALSLLGEKGWGALAEIAVALGGLLLLTDQFGKVGIKSVGVTVAALSGIAAGLTLLWAALELYGHADIVTLVEGIGKITLMLLALAGVSRVLAKAVPYISSFGMALTPLTTNMLKGAAAVMLLSLGLTLLGPALVSVAVGLGAFLTAIIMDVDLFFEAIGALIASMFNFIKENFPAAVEAVANAIGSAAAYIAEHFPEWMEKGKQLINNLIQGLKENWPEIALTALSMVSFLAAKLIENIPVLIEAAVSLGAAFLEWLGQTISDAYEWVKTKASEIGENIVEGVKQGLEDFKDGAIKKITSFGWELLKALMGALKEHSPSKATEEMGVNLVKGIDIGLDDVGAIGNLKSTISGVGDTVLDSLSGALPDTSEMGIDLVGDLAGGISSGIDGFDISNLNGIGNGITSAIGFGDGYSVGQQFTIDMSEGITDNQEPVDEAMVGVMQGALGQAEAQVNGDETLTFRDIGASIPTSIAEGINSTMPEATNMSAKMGSALKDAVETAEGGDTVEAMGDLGTEMGEAVGGNFFDQLFAAKDGITFTVNGITQTIKDGVTTCVEEINHSAEGIQMPTITPEVDTTKVKEEADDLSTIFEDSEESVAEMGETVSGIKDDSKTAQEAMKALNMETVNTTNNIIKFTQEFEAKLQETIEIIKQFIDASTDVLAELMRDVPKYVEAGQKLISGMISGFNNKSSELVGTARTLSGSAVGAIDSYYYSFYDCGRYLVQGFAYGIEDYTYIAEQAAAAMAAAAAAAAAAEAQINSPSRVFRNLGQFIPLGFAQGITDNAGVTDMAARGMVQNAVQAAKLAANDLAYLIENEGAMEPVIRPIVDLSDAEEKAKTLSTIFARESALKVQSSREAESNDNSTGASEKSSGTTYNFTQNNYSPKALSRIEIYRQTKNQFTALKGLDAV